jgi:hypothetical protein
MILDTLTHRRLLLEIMKTMNFPGAVLEDIYELKMAIVKATIGAPAAPAAPVPPSIPPPPLDGNGSFEVVQPAA